MFKVVEERNANFLTEDNNELDYQKFNLHDSEQMLFDFQFTHTIDAIACNHYFLAPKKILSKENFYILEDNCVYEVQKKSCQFAKCYLTEKNQIVIGRFEQCTEKAVIENNYIELFKNKILACHLSWTNYFLQAVYFYLRNRRISQNDVIINKEVVQVFIGDVIQHLKSAEQLIKDISDVQAHNSADYQLTACKELKAANQILARLYGGRAFLSGNIIEMIMVFEYFKDIYFN